MIGILLLFISIYLYMSGRKRYSILLFLSFTYSGMRVLTDSILGIKNIDLAVIYTCVISAYSYFYEKQTIKTPLDKLFKILLVMVLICYAFSYFYYGFSFMQILQGGRSYLILLSFYFIKKQKPKDVEWIIKILFYVTFITAVLYILQVVLELPLLPYGETKVDPATGILRMYNEPTFLVQFLYLTCLFPKYVGSFYNNNKLLKFAFIVLLIALLLTQSRMFTFMSLLFWGIGMWIKDGMTKILKYSILICLVMLPLATVLENRIEGGNTYQDLKSVYSGEYKKSVYAGKGFEGSLSYRFAWMYERMEFLKNRPLSENLFGLGIISESQVSTIGKLYDFGIGIQDKETGYRQQIGTPDIIYGSFIASFGYLGAMICIWFWFSLCRCLYKNRNSHPFVYCYSIYIMFCFVASFTGGYLLFRNLVMPFLLLALLYNKYGTKKSQSPKLFHVNEMNR